jgi:hypothetical protein
VIQCQGAGTTGPLAARKGSTVEKPLAFAFSETAREMNVPGILAVGYGYGNDPMIYEVNTPKGLIIHEEDLANLYPDIYERTLAKINRT